MLHRRHAVAALASFVAVAVAYGNDAKAECKLAQAASIEASLAGGRLTVATEINGHPTRLVVASAWPDNFIDQKALNDLGLSSFQIQNSAYPVDMSGTRVKAYARAKQLKLDKLIAEDVKLLISPTWQDPDTTLQGLLSSQFLADYDVELDLAHKKMNLYEKAKECGASVVYWADEAVIIPFEVDRSLHAVFPVVLDGKKLSAIIDTGASGIFMYAPAAKHYFQLDEGSPNKGSVTQVAEITGNPIDAYETHFDKLEISGLAFNKISVTVIPDLMTDRYEVKGVHTLDSLDPHRAEPKADMIIGLDKLSKLRIFMSYSQQIMYITGANATKAAKQP